MVIEATNLQNSKQTLLTTRFSHSSVVDHSSLVIPVWKSKLFFSAVDRDIFLYLCLCERVMKISWILCSLILSQDCQDSLQNSEPEINFALEYGGRLVDDDITDPEDKTKINEEVEDMAKALTDLKEDAAKERKRYYAQVVSPFGAMKRSIVHSLGSLTEERCVQFRNSLIKFAKWREKLLWWFTNSTHLCSIRVKTLSGFQYFPVNMINYLLSI